MRPHMPAMVRVMRKSGRTELTLVRFLAVMNPHVFPQHRLVGEALCAICCRAFHHFLEILRTVDRIDVTLQIDLVGELFGAQRTVQADGRMHLFLVLVQTRLFEHLVAHVTLLELMMAVYVMGHERAHHFTATHGAGY
jgi:hypothetical protein